MSSAKGISTFVPSLLWSILIFILSVLPSDELPDTDIEFSDKIAHFFVYAVLSVLLVRDASFFYAKQLRRKHWVLLILLVSCYGIGIEILQSCCIPTRFGEVADGVANTAGAIFGLVLAFRFKR